MRAIALLLFSLGGLFAQPTFDNAADMGSSSSGTFTTGNFTVGAGSNRIVLLYTHSNLNSAGYITGVTYNGVAMTSTATAQHCNPANPITGTMWYLVAPASGAHAFVISSAGGTNTDALAISYANASQTGVPDSNTVNCLGQAGGDALYTVSVTTVAANCVLVMGLSVGNYAMGLSATGFVQASQAGVVYLSDRTVTTAGANTISLESIFNGGVETAMITVGIAPAGGAAASVRHKSTIL